MPQAWGCQGQTPELALQFLRCDPPRRKPVDQLSGSPTAHPPPTLGTEPQGKADGVVGRGSECCCTRPLCHDLRPALGQWDPVGPSGACLIWSRAGLVPKAPPLPGAGWGCSLASRAPQSILGLRRVQVARSWEGRGKERWGGEGRRGAEGPGGHQSSCLCLRTSGKPHCPVGLELKQSGASPTPQMS